jgi:hypothetical protein
MIAKKLSTMGYRLKKTSDTEARWMVISEVIKYHWDFKDLKCVERFIENEKSMYRAARAISELRSN